MRRTAVLATVFLLFASVGFGAKPSFAFGGDNSDPTICTSVITPKVANITDSFGNIVGQQQLRWSGSCYYGSAWSRTCSKSGYVATWSAAYRIIYPSSVGYGASYTRQTNQPGSLCTSGSYAYMAFSGTLFDNCAAAGLGTCKVRTEGQIYDVYGNYAGDNVAGDY